MNKQLTQDELSKLTVPTILPMTRREKLMHWAGIVRKANQTFVIFHGLETIPPARLAPTLAPPGSAFAAAVADPIFQDAGLGKTIGDNMTFFELSQADLHEFSCNCGGHISNAQMADRIEAIATRGEVVATGYRIVNGIKRAMSR